MDSTSRTLRTWLISKETNLSFSSFTSSHKSDIFGFFTFHKPWTCSSNININRYTIKNEWEWQIQNWWKQHPESVTWSWKTQIRTKIFPFCKINQGHLKDGSMNSTLKTESAAEDLGFDKNKKTILNQQEYYTSKNLRQKKKDNINQR